MIWIQYLFLLPVIISARKYSGDWNSMFISTVVDSEHERLYRLPQLLHLDDYNRCLVQQDGLYCFGSFELTPTKFPHPTYEYMKEYSSDIAHRFNRTRIHRGYCVSERCPSHRANASVRFQECVADWAQKLSLRPTLHKLEYCRTHEDTVKTHVPDKYEQIFLYIVIVIIVLNVVGTINDCWRNGQANKSSQLTIWSIPANWQRLINTTQGEDSRLNDLLPTHGFKVVPVFLALIAHVYGGHIYLLSHEPHQQEDKLSSTFGLLINNGTGLIRSMATLAAFLTSYNLLLLSEKVNLSIKMLPLVLLKRITRMAPLFLLMTGFMATWWVHIRDGPLWFKVANERSICRRKFWTHVLFVSNIVEPKDMCLSTSWSLVMDVQLSIICCALTLTMARMRRRALPILTAMTLATSVFNAIRGYMYEWVPFREMTYPEGVHTMFSDVPAFQEYYLSFWSSLPSSLMGVYLAHLHYELQREKFNVADHKWLVISTEWIIPIFVYLIILISWTGKLNRLSAALFLGFENAVISFAIAFAYFGAINFKGFNYNFYSWRGFQILGRLILPLATISWPVHMTMAASRPHPNLSSWLDYAVDVFATYIITVLISIPMTVLVEIPMRRFFDNLIFSSYVKAHASKKNKAE